MAEQGAFITGLLHRLLSQHWSNLQHAITPQSEDTVYRQPAARTTNSEANLLQ